MWLLHGRELCGGCRQKERGRYTGMEKMDGLKRKAGIRPGMELSRKNGAEYLTFPAISETGLVSHMMTMRAGGVSEGDLWSMNLSFSRGDRRENVEENFRRAAALLGCGPEDIVCSDQTHTTNIRRVTAADRGKGVVRPKDFSDVDGLITDEPGIALATFYADCVPLLFWIPCGARWDCHTPAGGERRREWRRGRRRLCMRPLEAVRRTFLWESGHPSAGTAMR